MNKNILWQDVKRWYLGLPWSFTKYVLYNNRLIIQTGFLNTDEEEILLYRIKDISLLISFSERIFGLGTIKLISTDENLPVAYLCRIKNPHAVRDMLSDLIEESRQKQHVVNAEMLGK